MLADKLRFYRAVWLVLVLLLVLFPEFAFSQEATSLTIGKSLERSITGGETHAYTVDLEPNQYARVTIEQLGIDLVARFRDAEGNILADFDVEPRTTGQEVVDLVTAAKCSCSFTVEPRQKSAAAAKYNIAVTEIRAATPKDFALDEARKSAAQSVKLWRGGDYDKALPLAQHALDIREKELGPINRDVGLALFTLANVYSDKPDYQKAESLYLRAVETLQKALGEDHILNSTVLNNLGIMYKEMGLYAKAETTLKKALAIREKNLEPNHLLIASTLNNLGIIAGLKGDTDAALAYYQRSLEIREKALGPDHPDVATSLNNIANLYDDPAKVESLYLRALKIREARLGPDSLDVGQTLYNLALLYGSSNDTAKAEAMCTRALSIFENKVGGSHPFTGYAVNLLAVINKNKGDLARAEELYLRSIDIKLKSQGPYHPDLAGAYANLANLYFLEGKTEKALDAQGKANEIIEYNTALSLVAGSEKDKLGYLSGYAPINDQSVTFGLKAPPGSDQAVTLGAQSVLRWKGRVLDSMSDSIGALRRRFSQKDQALLGEFVNVSTRLSNLVLSGPQDVSEADFNKETSGLEAKRDALEGQISTQSSGFFQRNKPVTVAAAQSAIPQDAALIEYAVYRPSSPKDFELVRERSFYAAVANDPRYVAYIILPKGQVRQKDLGPVSEIDKIVDSFRTSVRDRNSRDVKQLGKAVYDKLIKPIKPFVGDSSRLLLSPDGDLNLMPFEALVDEKNRYLIESYSISYLSSGRDLLRMHIRRDSQAPPLIVANPSFGEPQDGMIEKVDLVAKRSARQSITTTRSITDTYFAPLDGTAQEARSIQSLFPNAKLLSGAQATETALKQMAEAPSILHLATHGFFLTEAKTGSGKNGQTRSAGPVNKIENPLLRSGLALAGANEHREASDDGILTALEASGLNLWGTKLVVLSACDTGLGEVRTGEGVYGLRRSFQLAGAESLVMSLWPVSDYVTRELMTGYYTNLKQGIGRSESLREVQLELLKKPATRHPFYWASFIESGDWTPLSGK